MVVNSNRIRQLSQNDRKAKTGENPSRHSSHTNVYLEIKPFELSLSRKMNRCLNFVLFAEVKGEEAKESKSSAKKGDKKGNKKKSERKSVADRRREEREAKDLDPGQLCGMSGMRGRGDEVGCDFSSSSFSPSFPSALFFACF